MTAGKYMSLNIAVCDDDEADRKRIKDMTAELLSADGINFSIFTYDSAENLMRALKAGMKFQLLLLDVMMEETDGFSLAAALRQQGDRTAIVFISSNRELAMRGYEVSAVRYLAKPVERDKLQEALAYCCQECLAKREILLPTAEGRSRILLSELMYAEAQDRTVHMYMPGREVVAAMKFSELQKILPDSQFVLIHRAYLVNMSYVQSMSHWNMHLKDGKTLPVSKYRYETVLSLWAEYLNG